jgi:hypothetical protein
MMPPARTLTRHSVSIEWNIVDVTGENLRAPLGRDARRRGEILNRHGYAV